MALLSNIDRLWTIFGLVIVVISSTEGQGFPWSNDNNCRKGLCPYVKKLVPDLHSHPAISHYNPLVHGAEPPSLCGNICTSDFQCPDHQKCCPTHCGYACFDSVYVADSIYHHGHHHNSHSHNQHYNHHHDSHNHHHNTHHDSHNHHQKPHHESNHHQKPHHDSHNHHQKPHHDSHNHHHNQHHGSNYHNSHHH